MIGIGDALFEVFEGDARVLWFRVMSWIVF